MESKKQNKLMNKIEAEAWGTWNRLKAVRGERCWGHWMKEVKRLAKQHICMTHRHRQQCGDGQRAGGGGQRQGVGNGDTCNSANNKNKVKKRK